MYQFIDDELNSHLADAADDLIAQGWAADQARDAAQAQFGDTAAIRAELKRLHPPIIKTFLVTAGVGYVLFALILFVIIELRSASVLALMSQQLLLRWWLVTALLVGIVIDHWVLQFFGIVQRRTAVIALIITQAIAMVITLVLDVNNFETVIHTTLFAVIVGTILWFTWNQLSFIVRRLLIVFTSGIMISSAALQQPLFNWLLPHPCLYLIKDPAIPLTGALAGCQQLPWYHPLLWILYVVSLVSVMIIGYFVIELWHNSGSHWSRRLIISSTLLLIAITPVLTRNINNHGALDIIPWQRDIYTAYMEILGRAPQDKDMQFYAVTESYSHMSQIKAVLYASRERRLKIRQVLQDTTGQNPSKKTVQRYAKSYKSIEQIRLENVPQP